MTYGITIRGSLKKAGQIIYLLELDNIDRGALECLGLGFYELESETSITFRREVEGTSAMKLVEVPFMLWCQISPPKPPDFIFGVDMPHCEACYRLLGPDEERWCAVHARRDYRDHPTADVLDECTEHVVNAVKAA